MESLDQNGDGVDKCEYVVGMLLRLEKIKDSDVESLIAQFEELDKSGDGHLDHEDIILAAKECQDQAADTLRRQETQEDVEPPEKWATR